MSDRLTGKSSLTRRCYLPILGGALLCIVFLLSSCNGFLEQNDTKEQIKRKIQYENSSFYTIYVDYSISYGTLKSPSGGEISKKVTDTFDIKFNPADEYEFLYWEILDKTTKQKLSNGEYLSLASIYESETQCTFLKVPEQNMKLCLSPVVTARPKVISNTPKMKNEGVSRALPIEVMFDQSMAVESIYYTQEEYDSFIQTYGAEHISFLPKGGNQFEQNKYYGYIIDNEPDTIVFKNIQITKNNTQHNNLLQYYEAPVFNEDKTQLTIAVKKTGNTPDLPAGTSILVVIDKGFYSISEELNKKLNLCESKKWPYFAIKEN